MTKSRDSGLDDTAAPTDPSLDRTAAAPSASNVSLDATAAAPSGSNVSLDRTAAAPSSSNPSLDATVADKPVASGSGTGARNRRVATDVGFDVGQRVGRYVVASKLGAGGMGVVLAAYDPELDRKVAIKLVRTERSGDAEGMRARMVREAQAMARLAHPNVLSVFDVGTVGGDVFVAMELVDGTTLSHWLKTPHSRREILRVFEQAGRGLAAAHAAGLVHRDFKPDNVMIGKDGRVRVMDFGLARQSEASEPVLDLPIAQRTSALSIELTHAGAVLGTPVYMAPEQWAGQVADARTDQYAFCVALWEALYGVRPFSASTIEELQTKVTSQPPDSPPPEIKLPRRLGGALRRGLEKDPAARFPTIEALLDELAAEPLARRRLAFAALGVGLLGAGAVVTKLAIGGGAHEAKDTGCDDLQVQLAGTWDAARKAKVHDAILATKSPIAAQTWTLLEHELDAKSADYLSVFAPTCHGEYHVPEHLRAAQTVCLGRVKNELAAFSDVLVDLKPKELRRVVEAAWGLPSAAACNDATALAQRTPQAKDPKVAAEVEKVHALLAKADAAKSAGRGKQALDLAEAAFAAAQKTGDPDARGQAGKDLGGIAAALGDSKRGKALLEDAYTTLLSAGDDYHAASTAMALAKIIGVDEQKPDAARPWQDNSGALVKRLGSPIDIDREWNAGSGMIRYAVGDFDGARPFMERALELGKKMYGEASPRYAIELSNLAGVLLGKGDFAGAAKMSQQALEIRKRTLGPEHPDVAENVMNLGLILSELGKLDEAEADERAALALREKLLGPDHPDIVIALFNLGSVLFKEKKLPEARDVAERALAMSKRLHGDDHPDTVDATENLADVTAALGDKAKARALYEQVLATRQKILEPGHPDIQRAKDNLTRLAKQK